MANALLDFVMALARDPAAAARYSADPAGILAAAGLPGVTAADVDDLMPMVADSLAMSRPDLGGPGVADGNDPNVWASGAAAVAFDAFGPFEPVTPPGPAVAAAPVVDARGPAEVPAGPELPAGEGPADAVADPLVSPSRPSQDPAQDVDHDLGVWDHAFPIEHHAGWGHPDPPSDPLIP